jgi:hypothetical protein
VAADEASRAGQKDGAHETGLAAVGPPHTRLGPNRVKDAPAMAGPQAGPDVPP